jgi:hypothetical protein
MRTISDEILVVCYLESLELQLDQDFIELLLAEMELRRIQVPSPPTKSSHALSSVTLQAVR